MQITRIGLLCSSSKIGGTELSTMRIGRILNKNGYESVIIAPGSDMREELNQYGINFIQCKFGNRSVLGLFRGIASLVKVFNSESLEIIHCQDAYSSFISFFANKFAKNKAPIIFHLRGINNKSYYLMAKFQKMFSIVIANSRSERNKLIDKGFNPNKIIVIYNGIENDEATKSKIEIRNELNIKDDEFVIGSVGRLADNMKGNFFLLKTFEQLIQIIPNVRLLYVGDGPDRQKLEDYSREHGFLDKVIFTGFRRDIPDLFRAMDIFAFPSWWEPFGNVAVEAMYEKVPVVASYVGGIPEIITHMDNGLLVTSGVEQEWIDAFRYLYDNPMERDRMINTAYTRAIDKYSFDRLFKELNQVYEQLIDGGY